MRRRLLKKRWIKEHEYSVPAMLGMMARRNKAKYGDFWSKLFGKTKPLNPQNVTANRPSTEADLTANQFRITSELIQSSNANWFRVGENMTITNQHGESIVLTDEKPTGSLRI